MTDTATLRTVDCPAMWGGLLDGGYDEYNRRVGSRGPTETCGICGRTIVPSRAFAVHTIDGGATLLHPDDESRYTDDGGDMGLWAIGSTCAKHVPAEYRIPLSRIAPAAGRESAETVRADSSTTPTR